MDGETEPGWVHKVVEEGEFAGWSWYSADPFEDLAGPFYYRKEADGRVRSAFRAERKHLNGSGALHGGILMTFADYAIFCIGRDALQGSGSVTAQMSCDFVDAGYEGDLIECTGEIVRGGASLVFLRGEIHTSGRTLFTFSAIIKKIRRKGPDHPAGT